MQIASSPCGTVGLTHARVGSPAIWSFALIRGSRRARNGCWPVKSSYSTTPSANTSERGRQRLAARRLLGRHVRPLALDHALAEPLAARDPEKYGDAHLARGRKQEVCSG